MSTLVKSAFKHCVISDWYAYKASRLVIKLRMRIILKKLFDSGEHDVQKIKEVFENHFHRDNGLLFVKHLYANFTEVAISHEGNEYEMFPSLIEVDVKRLYEGITELINEDRISPILALKENSEGNEKDETFLDWGDVAKEVLDNTYNPFPIVTTMTVDEELLLLETANPPSEVETLITECADRCGYDNEDGANYDLIDYYYNSIHWNDEDTKEGFDRLSARTEFSKKREHLLKDKSFKKLTRSERVQKLLELNGIHTAPLIKDDDYAYIKVDLSQPTTTTVKSATDKKKKYKPIKTFEPVLNEVLNNERELLLGKKSASSKDPVPEGMPIIVTPVQNFTNKIPRNPSATTNYAYFKVHLKAKNQVISDLLTAELKVLREQRIGSNNAVNSSNVLDSFNEKAKLPMWDLNFWQVLEGYDEISIKDDLKEVYGIIHEFMDDEDDKDVILEVKKSTIRNEFNNYIVDVTDQKTQMSLLHHVPMIKDD